MPAMRTLALFAALAAILASCTVAQPGRDEFAAATAGRTAGTPESCVPIESQQPLRVVDPQTLAVEVGRPASIRPARSSPKPGAAAIAAATTSARSRPG